MLGWGRLFRVGEGPYGGLEQTEPCAVYGPPILKRRGRSRGETTCARPPKLQSHGLGNRERPGVMLVELLHTEGGLRSEGIPLPPLLPKSLLWVTRIGIGVPFPSLRISLLFSISYTECSSSPLFLSALDPIHPID